MLSDYYTHKPTYEKISDGRLNAIQKLIPRRRPLTILDIGCGSGTLGNLLKSDTDISVFGVDISSRAVEAAQSVLDGAWVVDIESPGPWPREIGDRRYDLVLLSEVLEHLFSPEHLLRTARRFLKDEGTIIITVPNILFWRNRLRILLGHFEYEEVGLMDRGHIHFFSWHSFNELFRQESFFIEAEAHVVPTRILRPLARLLPGLVARQFAVRIKPISKIPSP